MLTYVVVSVVVLVYAFGYAFAVRFLCYAPPQLLVTQLVGCVYPHGCIYGFVYVYVYTRLVPTQLVWLVALVAFARFALHGWIGCRTVTDYRLVTRRTRGYACVTFYGCFITDSLPGFCVTVLVTHTQFVTFYVLITFDSFCGCHTRTFDFTQLLLHVCTAHVTTHGWLPRFPHTVCLLHAVWVTTGYRITVTRSHLPFTRGLPLLRYLRFWFGSVWIYGSRSPRSQFTPHAPLHTPHTRLYTRYVCPTVVGLRWLLHVYVTHALRGYAHAFTLPRLLRLRGLHTHTVYGSFAFLPCLARGLRFTAFAFTTGCRLRAVGSTFTHVYAHARLRLRARLRV